MFLANILRDKTYSRYCSYGPSQKHCLIHNFIPVFYKQNNRNWHSWFRAS